VSRSHKPGVSVSSPIERRASSAGNRDAAGVGQDQPGQHPHRRRLAGTVRAEQRDNLAGLHGEREIADGDAIAERAGQAIGGEEIGSHRCLA
jgi:hypothetical protein